MGGKEWGGGGGGGEGLLNRMARFTMGGGLRYFLQAI